MLTSYSGVKLGADLVSWAVYSCFDPVHAAELMLVVDSVH